MNHRQTGLRVGVDLTSIDEVERSVARFGDRYVRRLFTNHEIESCSPEVAESPLRGSPLASQPKKRRSKC